MTLAGPRATPAGPAEARCDNQINCRSGKPGQTEELGFITNVLVKDADAVTGCSANPQAHGIGMNGSPWPIPATRTGVHPACTSGMRAGILGLVGRRQRQRPDEADSGRLQGSAPT
jgi:hypothetical protein